MGLGDNKQTNGQQAKKWRANRPTVTWGQADAKDVLAFIDNLTQCGCAVIFNRSSNGHDLILGLYAGNDRPQDYLQTPSEIRGYMQWLVENYGDVHPTP